MSILGSTAGEGFEGLLAVSIGQQQTISTALGCQQLLIGPIAEVVEASEPGERKPPGDPAATEDRNVHLGGLPCGLQLGFGIRASQETPGPEEQRFAGALGVGAQCRNAAGLVSKIERRIAWELIADRL